MDTAEEDASDDDPERAGQPSERSSADGAGDGACAGDGREVMSHQDRCLGGDVVDTVLHGVGGGLFVVVNTPFLGKPGTVKTIAAPQSNEGNDQK